MIYHIVTDRIECECGAVINDVHKCSICIAEIKYCDYTDGKCEKCARQERDNEIASYWDSDWDGYFVCSECHMKCIDGQTLPKGCECEFDRQWDLGDDGKCICSECYVKCDYGELPKKCECSILQRMSAFDRGNDSINFDEDDCKM
jgi:hypothetical protein